MSHESLLVAFLVVAHADEEIKYVQKSLVQNRIVGTLFLVIQKASKTNR